MKSGQTMTAEYTWTVKKVAADGKADLAQRAERIRLKMELPGALSVDYDSKDGGEIGGVLGPMLDPVLKAMLQGEIKFQMSPNGKVENVEFSVELSKALKATARPGGAVVFSEATLKQMFETFPSFPAEPLSAGKGWDQHVQSPPRSARCTRTPRILIRALKRKAGESFTG